ncbi:DUF3309 family protein [Ralstonia syzygii subsp. celebesensis]|uniref:Uncharacterized protein n=2 Tax=Ralstonia syzygii subsp. celebesensis TaxID=1310168 RepID=A0A1U9VI51_9RALS|nr:hypothetical protein B0B51_07525 [blood disease bacterium A2-HR MARDI]CCA80292.1 hypothethical protein [blood disease bacterium R229]
MQPSLPCLRSWGYGPTGGMERIVVIVVSSCCPAVCDAADDRLRLASGRATLGHAGPGRPMHHRGR